MVRYSQSPYFKMTWINTYEIMVVIALNFVKIDKATQVIW